jgi:membrane-bound lytic murein transglycosylase D
LVHSVQPGDTLWNISKKYNGISVEQIKKLNKLKGDALKPGQKLVLS